MQPAIFLDRDGVIIQNRPDYIRSWSQVSVYAQALIALKRLSQSDYQIVIITNQSAIGRGLMTRDTAEGINTRLVNSIQRAGGRVDGVYMCPHAPEEACNCRKPAPGLLLQAADELKIDLAGSTMVGDAVSDIQAGLAAGIPNTVLLLTGRGRSQRDLLDRSIFPNTKVISTLDRFALSLLNEPPDSSKTSNTGKVS